MNYDEILEQQPSEREAREQDEANAKAYAAAHPAPKFCKDCKWIRPKEPLEASICTHQNAIMPGSSPWHPITGELIEQAYYCCDAMRAGICQHGKLWEPKT